MADSTVRPDPPTERRGGYPANGVKVGDLPKPPKDATVGYPAEPGGTAEPAEAATSEPDR